MSGSQGSGGILTGDQTRETDRYQIMQGLVDYSKDFFFYPKSNGKKSFKDCKEMNDMFRVCVRARTLITMAIVDQISVVPYM